MTMIYLVDGHNVIFAGAKKFRSATESGRRAELVRKIRDYLAGKRGIEVVVVFDSRNKYPAEKTPKSSPKVRVIYASENRNADEMIDIMVQRAKNPREIVVVSSDRQVLKNANYSGARTMTAEEFWDLILPAEISDDDADEKPEILTDEEMADWKKYLGID